MTELEFSKMVHGFIEKNLGISGYGYLKARERVNILNSLTLGRIDNEWKVIFGFLEQDIVIYRDEMDSDDLKNSKIVIPRGTKDKKIIIPLAICELKVGQNINTHQFITYSHIARELKSVFPHCAYYFVSSGQERQFSAETLLRHTKEFDRVFMDWEKDKDVITKDLISHFEYLKRVEII